MIKPTKTENALTGMYAEIFPGGAENGLILSTK